MSRTTWNAGDLVRHTMERDAVVRRAMERQLLNSRALARSIEMSAEGKVTFDAVLSAIRRYESGMRSTTITEPQISISKITLKNQISVISVRNDGDIQRDISRFSQQLDYSRGETFRMVSTFGSLSVTIDSKNVKKLESYISAEQIIRRMDYLAELVIEMPLEIETSPGALASITTELALNDVIIKQLTTVGPGHIIILVEEKDAMDAYGCLAGVSGIERH